jgi:uncharacterized membrane protein YtjA (UPF0391 family)
MLRLIGLLLVVGLFAAVLGFGGVANFAFDSAQFLVMVLLIGVVLAVVVGVALFRRVF